jgi:acetylglutamate kinase
VTTADALAIVQASLTAVNEALCAAIGEAAVALFGDEIGLDAAPMPELGLVGEARPSELPTVRRALEEGRIPVVAPRGPLNVNADDAAAAIAIGIGADELLFLTDVDGLILDGVVVDSIGVDAAVDLLRSGSLEGGIIPKLGAAVTAARCGVRASIGQTAVAA